MELLYPATAGGAYGRLPFNSSHALPMAVEKRIEIEIFYAHCFE
jgi:hypothetical protein